MYIYIYIQCIHLDWINRIQAYEKKSDEHPSQCVITYEIPTYMWVISQQYMGYLSKKIWDAREVGHHPYDMAIYQGCSPQKNRPQVVYQVDLPR